MRGFKAYTLIESWIIRKAQEERQQVRERQYPTQPVRGARIMAVQSVPVRFGIGQAW